jgi:hypothetical protein
MKPGILMTALLFWAGMDSINAQVDYPDARLNKDVTAVLQDSGSMTKVNIVINQDMIDRFNNIQTQDSLYSWIQLIQGYDNQSVHDFFYTIHTSNLDNQSLAEIKQILEQKKTENEQLANNLTDEYFTEVGQIKKEINLKIMSYYQEIVRK